MNVALGRNPLRDARVAGAEFPGLACGVDDAQTAADDLEEFVATGMEGDAPDSRLAGPVTHGEGTVFGAVAFGG